MAQELTVTLEEVEATAAELARFESQSAKHAATLASEALEEVVGLDNDAELAGAWRDVSRNLAAIALGHSHRAAQYAPGSKSAVEARQHAEKAKSYAQAAANTARRD